MRHALGRHGGGATAPLVLGVAAFAAWIGFGVPVRDAVAYPLYLTAYVVLPGVVVAAALDPGASRVRRFLFGWALGYALEAGAYAAFAALGVRGLFHLWPLPFAVAAALAWRRRSGDRARSPGEPRALPPALAAVALLAVVYLALALYLPSPLPGTVAALDYDKDVAYWLSLAGEARHQWPLSDPNLTGERIPYHWLSFLHLAAGQQASGAPLATVVLRLDVLPMLLLAVMLLGRLGWELTRRAAAVPLTAALVLLVGELDLLTGDQFPFRNVFLTRWLLDPGILLAGVLLIPLVVVLRELLAGESRGRRWMFAALLATGACAAKGVVAPLVVGAAGVVAALAIWRGRRLPRPELAFLGVALLALATTWALLYRGAGGQLLLEPLASFERGAPESLWGLWDQYLGIGFARSPFELLFGLVGMVGPLIVGLALAATQRSRLAPRSADLCLGLLAAGALGTLLLLQDGNSHEFFLLFGAAAAAPLAAAGIADAAMLKRPGAGFLTACVAGALAVALAAPAAGLEDSAVIAAHALAVAAACLLAAIVFRGRRLAAAACVLLAVGVLDAPLDLVAPAIERRADGAPMHSEENRNLTPGLVEALAWVREETREDSVLAVNNQFRAPGDARYFFYSGLGERPVFLEGWAYANEGFARPAEIERRRALNRAVFSGGGRPALCRLVGEGVTHLFVDRVHGGGSRHIAPVLFANPDASVLDARRGCDRS